MNTSPKLAALLVAMSPLAVVAESPDWTFVEASYSSSEMDGGSLNGVGIDDIEMDGFEIAGSVGVGEWLFIDGRYSQESGDVGVSIFDNYSDLEGVVDIDLDRLSLGVGAAWSFTNKIDLYGRLAYEDWTFEASASGVSDDIRESGYSLAVGIRANVLSALELRAEIGNFDIDEVVDNEAGLLVAAYYTITDQFILGAGYAELGDLETWRATFRYQF